MSLDTNRRLLARNAAANGYDARTALALIRSPRSPLSASFPSATNIGTRTSTAFFPLHSRNELRPQDHREMVKKARFLRNASGMMRALFEKPVRYSIGGGLIPSSCTGDPDFDRASDAYFERWAEGAVDVSGQYNFYTAQPMLVGETHCDGDIFGIKVKSQWDQCQLQFIKSHQVGDHGSGIDSTGQFRNGVRANSLGRPQVYRILQDSPNWGITQFRDYSAEDVLHIYDSNRFGMSRGLPWAYHGENSALDILDIAALAKVTEKLNQALGAVISKTGAKPGLLGPPVDVRTMFGDHAGNTSNAEGSAATTAGAATGNISWEQILGGGAIPVLEDGQELKGLDLKRNSGLWIPSANWFIRDICVGFGVSYEFIWDMTMLGGPSTKFALEDLGKFCDNDQRMLISRYCQPVRSWVVANGIMAGEIPECRAPDWFACNWVGPQKVTINRNEAANYIRLIEKGMMTRDEWWSSLGKDGRKMRRAVIEEIAEDIKLCKELGVPYEIYSALAAGTPAAVSADGGQPDSTNPEIMREAIRAAVAEALTLP